MPSPSNSRTLLLSLVLPMWLFLSRPISTSAFSTLSRRTRINTRQLRGVTDCKNLPLLLTTSRGLTTSNSNHNRVIPNTDFSTTQRRLSNRDDSDLHNTDDNDSIGLIDHDYKVGDKIMLEVVSFGPLGATVHVVASSHNPQDLPPEDEEWPVLAIGLIPQKELGYFRDQRRGMEVVLGEVLPGFVERVRDSDQRIAVGLRAFGGKQKAQDVGQQILQLLKEDENGILDLGDKSSPADISAVLPGVSKSSFKKAVSALFKQEIIDKPQRNEISLSSQWMQKLKNK